MVVLPVLCVLMNAILHAYGRHGHENQRDSNKKDVVLRITSVLPKAYSFGVDMHHHEGSAKLF